jgi:4-amino-4-deoxy-L-arabinose transferase-like glycosyltransferase
MLLLGVLLGALICRWAKDLGGRKAGLLALALYAFDPNCIAHSALITTDVAAVLFIVATLYLVQSPKSKVQSQGAMTRRWFFTGVLLGLAQLAKVSP